MKDSALFWPLALTTVALWAAQGIVNWRFTTELRRRHPQMWKLFGGDEMWGMTGFLAQWGVVEILLRGTYIGTGSNQAERFCAAYSFPVIAAFFLAVLSTVLLVALTVAPYAGNF